MNTDNARCNIVDIDANTLGKTLDKFRLVIARGRHGCSENINNIAVSINSGKGLRLIGNAGYSEISLQHNVDTIGDCCGDGQIVVNFTNLIAVVGTFKNEKITVSINENAGVLTVQSATTGHAMDCQKTIEYGAFPMPESTGNEEAIRIPANKLVNALWSTEKFVAKGDTRYSLNHIYVANRPHGGIELVASNTHFLNRYGIPEAVGAVPEDSNAEALTAISPSAAKWLIKHAEKAGEISLTFKGVAAFIKGQDWEMRMVRTEGMFPHYMNVFPNMQEMRGKVTVNRQELLEILKQAKPFLAEENPVVQIKSAENGYALSVFIERDGIIQFERAIPAAARKCPPMSFTCDFLATILTVDSRELVEILFHERAPHDNPVLFLDGETDIIIMPVNQRTAPDLTDYAEALSGPDQEYPGKKAVAAPKGLTIRPPSFKAVVNRAKSDPEYMQTLLNALGVNQALAS